MTETRRLLIRAGCSEGNLIGDFAVLEFGARLRGVVKARIRMAEQATSADGSFHAMKFWDDSCDWYSSEDGFEEDEVLKSKEANDEIEKKGYVDLPDTFEAPCDTTSMEMAQMVVDAEGVWFMAYPRHTSLMSETRRIPFKEFGL